jgi:hypothetical protein
MSDPFIEFEVAKTVNGGLILKAGEERGAFAAFLRDSQMSRSLKQMLEHSDLSSLRIKARFLSESSTGLYPDYTQRNYYEAGKAYSFRFAAETEYEIFLIGSDDCEYHVAKSIWERGPKFKSYEFGVIIDCRVISSRNGYPTLERVKVVNPYYVEIEELISNHSVVRDTFLNWIDSPSDERKAQLKSDYEKKNANWIFTYAKLLDEYIYTLFATYDFTGLKPVIESALEIEQWIISSGFLLTQGQDRRQKTSLTAEVSLKRLNSYLEWLELLRNPDLTNGALLSIVTFFKASILPPESNTLTVEIADKVGLLNFLLRFQIPELLSMELVEQLVVIYQEKMLINFHEFKYVVYLLSDRRKYYRNKLFAQHSNMTYDEFVSNRDLQHFLRLTQFDMWLNEYYGNHAEASLQLAETKLLEAYLCSDLLEKRKIAGESYDALNALILKREDFTSEEKHKQWSREKNLRLGRHCEFLAYYTNEMVARMTLLKKAQDHYYGVSKRGYLISYYRMYYNYVRKVLDQQIEDMRAGATKSRDTFEHWLQYCHVYPIVKDFYDMFSILSVLGNETVETYTSLLSHICERSNSKSSDILNCDSLARLVLANNLLLSLKQGENSFFLAQIKQLIVDREVSLPVVEEMTDEEEIKDTHILFSEEVQDLELKGSLHFDIKRFIDTGEKHKSEYVTKSILKTVVGMLNVTGGTIVLGVLESAKFTKDNEINSLQALGAVFVKGRILLGVQLDCQLLNIDIDQLMRQINELVKRISSIAPSYVQMRPEIVHDKTILNMTVRPYPGIEGVCLDNSEYYIRVNNETVKISAPEFVMLRMGRVHDFKNLPGADSSTE